ncbi:MarR family transcriptional regulator [Paucibacter sp. R3-3]|uniref:MarR family transcriptional regulator n=1 Tax=Roseateles agri TaxID=3098619 RepID=A0ABU5DRW5_9BURK|nr:MarR family transcriptional regulator [Paucibacter sp. R3-3]MDY0749066.1 MarR family transcriptional regulator [Paucibacter sp. R3-3]
MSKRHCPDDDASVQAGAGRPHLAYAVLLQKALHEVSVTYNQFLVMASLYERAGYRGTPSELSLDVGRTRSNVTLICNQLEDCGWVVRRHGLVNRRRVDITLTEAGSSIIRDLLFKLRPDAVPATDSALENGNA